MRVFESRTWALQVQESCSMRNSATLRCSRAALVVHHWRDHDCLGRSRRSSKMISQDQRPQSYGRRVV